MRMNSTIRRTPPVVAACAAGTAEASVIPTPVLMEDVSQKENKKIYARYNHTDPCKHLRWTARESYLYMHRRPWQKVVDFYSDLVGGRSSLSDLFPSAKEQHMKNKVDKFGDPHETHLENELPEDRRGRWARVTYKIVISYDGGSFDGWQKQPDLNTVQGLVERSLGGFVDENKAQQLKSKSLPVEPCALVAGRTDKGVSALRQVCSFYTWRNDISTKSIEEAVNNAAPGKLRALHVSKVSRTFHPNFSAKWRRYFYIFPLCNDEELVHVNEWSSSCDDTSLDYEPKKGCTDNDEGNIDYLSDIKDDESVSYTRMKPKCFSISKVNKLIKQLEGKSLSYKMFARDTKASRSIGPATDCYLFHARAAEARLSCANKVDVSEQRVMCVELVGNRFLRKMVRVLVATAIREAAAGADDEVLLCLIDATCRRATAPPAPPDGLCLAEVGYGEFMQESCLIV